MQKVAEYWRVVVLFSLLLNPVVSHAVGKVVILGLFTNKAVLEIDGKRRVLSVGQSSPEGVSLLAADSEGALLKIDGKEQRLQLGSHIGSHFTAPEQKSVTLWPTTNGMYQTTGTINGYTIDFLVDTGATTVAMNAVTAKRLGINYRLEGRPGVVETASGREKVYRVILDTVTVGPIRLRNITAMVLEGGMPRHVLLGMSFLGQLDMQREGAALMLKQKW